MGSNADGTEVRHLRALELASAGARRGRAGAARSLTWGRASGRAPGRLGVWLSRRCQDCGGAKPLVTAYCDACWERHEV